MRIGIVVDSACDLPEQFIKDNKIVVLPITLHLDGRSQDDTRDTAATLNFYRSHVTAAANAETTAFSPEQIKTLFLERLVLDYDLVYCFTIASSRSPMFEHANRASLSILSDYKAVRSAAGIAGPFNLRIVDTQNCFAGQSVSVVECVRMIRAGESHNKIRERLEYLVLNTHGYVFPRDLKQLRARAQKRGDKSVGWAQYLMGSALDIKPLVKGYRNTTGPVAKLRHFEDGVAKCFKYVEARIHAGLLAPVLTVSYGGPVKDLDKLPGYLSMLKTAQEKGIEVLPSTMSMVGGLHVGEGAVSFGFAAPEHELPF